MTRAERAACELALCLLRRACLRTDGSARGVDAAGGLFAAEEAASLGGLALYRIVASAILPVSVPYRESRARLALYLRALLRADRGDAGTFERFYCRRCGRNVVSDHDACCMCGSDDYMRCGCEQDVEERRARFRQLWTLAPAHDGTTPSERRAGR